MCSGDVQPNGRTILDVQPGRPHHKEGAFESGEVTVA